MSTIQLSGLQTGIDTEAIISQLMEVEKKTLTVYQRRQTTWQGKQTALDELRTKLKSLSRACEALGNSDDLRCFDITSSETDNVTAEASSSAYEGNHTVIVDQLANADRWVHTAGVEYAEDYIGAGTFIYSYNNQETSVTTSEMTTMEDLVGLINNDANNPGVTASLLYYNQSYHLVLNGNDAGSDYAIKVNSSSSEVWQSGSELTYNGDNASLSTRLTALEQFSGSLEGTETITISGTDHNGVAITPIEIDITDNTKISNLLGEINDAFDGIAEARFEDGNIILVDLACGTSQLSIDLTYNANGSAATFDLPTMAVQAEGGIAEADLSGFASGDFTNTQVAQNCRIKVDGYPSEQDSWLERSSNTIDDVITGVTLHLHNVTDSSGEEITLTRDIDTIKEKIDSLVVAYNSVVETIKEHTKYDESTGEAGVLMSDYTVSGIRQQIRNPFIQKTAGFIEDIDPFLSPLSIGLTFDKDGILEFDSNDFDQAVSENYMSVLALLGADKSGTSSNSSVKFYGASSTYTTAGEYDVEVVVSGGVITSAKIKLSTESIWRDMTIDDNVITGNSRFDENGCPVYSENGLQLSIDTSSDGTQTSTVRVKQGFAGRLEDVMSQTLKTSVGSFDIDYEHVQDQIEMLDDKIEDEQNRLSKREEYLIAKYARLEKTLALLQNQLSTLNASLSSS